ncbi:hypothetical protein [Streptomonospora halophila]|uniref:hypothetical protein n=1 Tax=Streptomonospora halophila TaxID=427369 RepID=UPI0031E5F6C7
MDTHSLFGDLAGGSGRIPGATRPRRTSSIPVAVTPMVDNRMSGIHGASIQAGVIHGSVTVHSLPTMPVPGWVGTALPVHQCDARELGAHNALPGSKGAGLPPYVVRDVDGELDRRLAAIAEAQRGGLVLVAGASTAGKTRALVAALDRTVPDRMLVAPPEDADLRPLPAWLQERAAQAPRGWVVWLDDLDRHLGASGLTPALVAELGGAGAVVASTIRRDQLEALRPSTTDQASSSEGFGYAVLKTPAVVVERRWNPQEREHARISGDERLIRAAADERFGVAEQLAAGPLLEPIWLSGPDSGHPRGYALVAAAVGLAAAGLSSGLTREQLHAAHGAYLPDPPPLPEEADQAWAWATRQRSGLAGLLVPVDHDGHRWRAFDYLTPQSPLPDAVWHTALGMATDQDLFSVGLTAYNADRDDITEAAMTTFGDDFEGIEFADPADYAHLLTPESTMCWWCQTRSATTGEHKFKRTNLARLMGDGQALVWGDGEQRREIRGKSGLKRDRYDVIKFPKSMCAPCNNDASQPFDNAYDTYAQYVETHLLRIMPGIDLGEVYGTRWRKKSLDLARYHAKHFGCRMVRDRFPVPQSLRDFMDGAEDMSDAHMVIISTDSVNKSYGQGMSISPTVPSVSRDMTRFTSCVMAAYIGPIGIRYEWVADGIPDHERDQFFHHPGPVINYFRNEKDMVMGETRKPGRLARFLQWANKP